MRSNNKLDAWMRKHNKRDDDVARAIRSVSRVQINRIRRGVSFASIKTAMRLEQLTRISWTHFVKQPPQRSRKAAAR